MANWVVIIHSPPSKTAETLDSSLKGGGECKQLQLGILSYYGNKSITCGEGGVILTNDENLAVKAYRLKNHGRDVKGVYVHDHIGFNFTFTDMQAAIGVAQMSKLQQILDRRKEVFNRYLEGLKGLDQVTPTKAHSHCEPAYWLSAFLAEDVENLVEFIYNQGIQTRRFFYPLHLQPCYKYMNLNSSDFIISNKLYNKGITLPSSCLLKNHEQEYIIEQMWQFYRLHCKP